MMTRRDFNALAALANHAVTNGGGEWLAYKLADICAQDDDKFDRLRFLVAALAGPTFIK